jgi:hypothetical protein
VAKQNVAADLQTELRSVHSGLHSALNALLKEYDPNECGRILMAIDERLTETINRLLTNGNAASPEVATDPRRTASVQLIHEIWTRSGAAQVVAAAAEEAGRPLEVKFRDDGIDLVSPGLPKPAATIRVELTTSTVLRFRPDFGLGAVAATPSDASLEAWAREASDMWCRVVRTALENAPKENRASVLPKAVHLAKTEEENQDAP